MNSEKDKNKFYPKILRGAGGGGSSCTPRPPPDPHTPEEADEGIYRGGQKVFSRTETEVTDLICEGPIEGLVSGKYTYAGATNLIGWNNYSFSKYASIDNNSYLRSVYWKNVPVIDDAGNYNFSQINFRYDNGNQVTAANLQSKINNATNLAQIAQTSRTLAISDTLRYGPTFLKNYDFKNTNLYSLIVTLKITALFRQQNDPNLDKITYDLGCGSTVKISQTAGDIRDRKITYTFKIFKITTFGYTEIRSLRRDEETNGKITSGILDTYTFVLDGQYDANDSSFLGWRVQIERTSPESTVVNLKDTVTVDSITEVFRESYIYPKCAIFKNLFTAEYFQNVPDRAYDIKLLKVKVPSNYDPIKKRYDGDWNGNFSDVEHPSGVGLYWTDNPAWCYYDLLTNKRYGLGKYIKNQQVDKWSIYQIAQYCDTIVDDGFGGLEPRFTCNTIINDFSEAFTLLNDMASIFRGMSYYANGSIFAIADAPKDPYILFTNSNVENGDFNYSSSSKKTRNTVAIIRYNDMDYFAKPTVEHVEDPEGVRKYGIRKLEITAFGCTSRGQAYRLGKWALASEQLETETVDFTAGLDSAYLRPGDVIKIQDSNRMMHRLGGRVLGITSGINQIHKFILDEEFNNISGYFSTNFPGQTYKFEILTPTSRTTGNMYSDFISNYQKSAIQSGLFQMNTSFITPATGYHPEKTLTEINCNKTFDTTEYNLYTGAIWTAQTTGSGFGINSETELYRVIGITEIEPFKYNINAMEYNPSKYLYVESGISFTDVPVVAPISLKEASYPSGLKLYKTEDLYLNYEISGAVDTTTNETFYWNTYIKSGSDFGGADLETQYANIQGTAVSVPKKDFFLTSFVTPSNNNTVTGNFIPTGNNQNYYFRTYGINPKGYYSRNYRANNFYFASTILNDYTNLIELNDFRYSTMFDNRADVSVSNDDPGRFQSVVLNTANSIHGKELDLEWTINNLVPILKIWSNNELTYRLTFGTGNFDGDGIGIESVISTDYVQSSNASSETIAYTGLNYLNLQSYLKDDVISDFWIAIDAKEKNGGVKYTSQQTLASAAYNQPHGYLFGLFSNDQMTSEKYDLNKATATIKSDNNISVVLPGAPSYIGDAYLFFTEQESSTGFLTPSNLNKIMYQQFTAPTYLSFVKALAASGIQFRRGFFNGVNTFNTESPMVKSNGQEGVVKSGYLAIKLSTKFEDNLMAQYDNDFSAGSAYDLNKYTKNSNLTSVAPVPVYYGSYPAGLTTTYRFPRVNDIGVTVDTDRQIVNNLVFLPQASTIPFYITNGLKDLVDNNQLSGEINALSGALSATISGLSGTLSTKISGLSGEAFLKNQNNSGHLTLASGYNINILSGNLNLSGNATLGRDYNNTITITGKFLRGIKSYSALIGSSQAGATIITSDKVIVTGAAVNGSLALPSGLYGAEIEVRNRSTQTILIYPTGNDRIAESNGALSAINIPISINNSGNRNFVYGFSGTNNIWFA